MRQFPQGGIIAEDLGIITDDVRAVMQKFGFPGMKVLLFAFNGDPHNPYLPHSYNTNSLVYTGTHDNNTIRGWFEADATDQEKENCARYLNHPIFPDKIHWDFITMAMMSTADIAIIPLQDVLGLSETARMNIPGTKKNNWQWRFSFDDISSSNSENLRDLTQKSSRG